jgi:glycopeptide antibiotics resistance protein
MALTALYVAAVGFIVFWPSAHVAISSVDGMLAILQGLGAPGWVSDDMVEFAANVALFLPLGFLGPLLLSRWPVVAWAALGFSASLMIELGQLAALPARSPAWYDVAANTLGALLGALVASRFRAPGHRPS